MANIKNKSFVDFQGYKSSDVTIMKYCYQVL